MSPEPQPCVWMTAGLLRYRLCDRDFDCDRCPLDAALRGAAPPAARNAPPNGGPALPEPGPVTFPEGRRYGDGHTWAGAPAGEDGGRVRVGLDALAAALLGPPAELRFGRRDEPVERGQPVCELVLRAGALPLGAPVPGRLLEGNHALESTPHLLLESPYDDGWLLEMAVEEGALEGLLDAGEARRRSAHDLRRFRRRIALHVLADGGGTDGLGPTLPDGGELVTDLRGLLGPRRYLELLREMVR